MQTKKKIEYKKISLNEFLHIVSSLLKEYNCIEDIFSYLFQDKLLFEFISAFIQIEVIDKNSKVDEILNKLKQINLYPYSIGEPIIKIKKGKVYPLLPIADYLRLACKNKIYLKDRKVIEKLTYGKNATLGINDILASEKLIDKGKYLIYDIDDIFICFSMIKLKNERVEIIPDLDIGWYLREGK
ncbi:hypothetical protein [Stygiolobus caldivivus]|uniref:Uncharacterized protein n=1 Tax=Stygiolobus caldivivus TaxID=2824673 RepID=A0A8D5U763_9CREN|nr:hypothetical protein [Stygiolobus caldivivus]BCU70563.1 hypothetical protein KN1_18600 [Stygiolobus caldivivus]